MERTWQFGQTWNIPNGLSLSRAFLGIMMPLWWYFGTEALLIVVLWAGISDGLDGWWARRFDARTPLGVVIDPLADKVFTGPFLLLAALWFADPLMWLLFLVNLGYDVDNTLQRRSEIEAAFLGRIIKTNRPVTWISKTKTAMLFLFMAMVASFEWFPVLPIDIVAGVSLLFVGTSWLVNRWTWIRDRI